MCRRPRLQKPSRTTNGLRGGGLGGFCQGGFGFVLSGGDEFSSSGHKSESLTTVQSTLL